MGGQHLRRARGAASSAAACGAIGVRDAGRPRATASRVRLGHARRSRAASSRARAATASHRSEELDVAVGAAQRRDHDVDHEEARVAQARRAPRGAPRGGPSGSRTMPPLPTRRASRLELRLHQQHEVAVGSWCSAASAGATVSSEMKDRSATASVDRAAEVARARASRTLVRSRTVTRGSVRSDHASCPRPTSTASTLRRARLQQAVGEPAGGRPGVEGPTPAHVDGEPRRARRPASRRRGTRSGAGRRSSWIGSSAPTSRAGAWARAPADEHPPGHDRLHRLTAAPEQPPAHELGIESPAHWSPVQDTGEDRSRRLARGHPGTPRWQAADAVASVRRGSAGARTAVAADRGSPRRPAARPRRSRPRGRARTAIRARRPARRRSTAGRPPSPRGAEALADDADGRRLRLARRPRARARPRSRPRRRARRRRGSARRGPDRWRPGWWRRSARPSRTAARRAVEAVEVEVAVEAHDHRLGRRLGVDGDQPASASASTHPRARAREHAGAGARATSRRGATRPPSRW